MEDQLTQQYGLKDAIVINRGKLSYAQTLRFVGEQGAQVFKNLMRNDQVIAISTGTSVYEVINALTLCPVRNVKVVQLLGSTGVKSDPSIDGPELAGSLAKKVRGSYYALNAPMLMDSRMSVIPCCGKNPSKAPSNWLISRILFWPGSVVSPRNRGFQRGTHGFHGTA
jgi:DNA-binding transcriptional regulator LsrR (DeoR family)